MKAVQNERNPCFVANLITTFLGDVENILAQLSTYLSAEDPDEVNYPQVATLALTLKGSSSRCIIVLDLILRENLNHIVQMERAIHENEVKRRNM
ncbi:PREDICTED: histidine-containing phosphotransfer [Prunus dulcis]|uniref:PREDICTED: histidine-containing phosphotransfer n=1 Tax=Prunus dulcis TaxID=3755 RepID=A0A5E4FD62_PRUDU|nr:PREDICTED: histidine-containing phosphotransfer [Prunus dulcis]